MPHRCVVFGGTGDIGGAIAEYLHRVGWAVVTVSRNPGPLFPHIAADVASEDSVAAAASEILQAGPVDAVVYAAGLAPDVQTPLSGYPSSDWRRTFSVYVDGLFYAWKAFFPSLAPGSHFLVLSSAITGLAADNLLPVHAGHYAAAKGAVDQFAKWARRDAHARGVLFSRLAPGSVRSAARILLGVPEEHSLPLDAVAAKAASALIDHRELDEEMLP